MDYTPGSLVRARNREWVVMPSNDKDLVLLKPLDGSEEEMTGIYLPLAFKEDTIESAEFPLPGSEDIGDIATARLLFNAARLSFRSGAGPFRSLAKLSFRPRAYQMVPLIMALKLNPVRLFIADDVGIGKTIEALLIVKELIERREIKRFAVICLPHLCEQWQEELKDKFGIEAVIIRSNTQARLDRDIHGDTSVFEYYPYQVISIDYIKSDLRRQVFIQHCPELIVVDEAHTCARPSGALKTQQQRYHLIHDIARKQGQNLIMLTATPHSGKSDEFQSLLGLIKPEFEKIDLPNASADDRKELAKHFIKRRRADVVKWIGKLMKEDTKFPARDSGEFEYILSKSYSLVYDEVLSFAQSLMKTDDSHTGRQRIRYWTALALLRGVMSSPAAGAEMLKNRMQNLKDPEEQFMDETNPVLDEDFGGEGDYTPTQVIEKTDFNKTQIKKLNDLAASLEKMQNLNDDKKAEGIQKIIIDWLKLGFNPVVFCRYIATANYLGEVLKAELHKFNKNLNLQVITSEDPDEVRKERIDGMASSPQRVLIATDCLSEGINLQDHFTAVLHYDLPWNPNRLEQREGRVDRFGQKVETVKGYMYYSKQNPIDGVVFRVILRKVREIRKSIGISIPFPEDSKSIMDAVLNAVLLKPRKAEDYYQLTLDFGESDPVQQNELRVTRAYDEAAAREKQSHSIFAQHTIKAEEIEEDLRQTDEAIGDVQAVKNFVVESVGLLGADIKQNKKGHSLFTINLPEMIKQSLPESNDVKISFDSPTPEGYLYIGRNHLFVEQLCQYLIAMSFQHDRKYGPSRVAVIRCKDVTMKTTLLLFRVRNLIEGIADKHRVVAEEMLMWGYRGAPNEKSFLNYDEAKSLMYNARPTKNITPQAQNSMLENELTLIQSLRKKGSVLDEIALTRAKALVEAHERFRKVTGGSRYREVIPVLPMDIMGMYILLPEAAP